MVLCQPRQCLHVPQRKPGMLKRLSRSIQAVVRLERRHRVAEKVCRHSRAFSLACSLHCKFVLRTKHSSMYRSAGHWSGSGTIDLTNGRASQSDAGHPTTCSETRRETATQYSLRQRQLQFRFARERHYSAGSVSGTWSESTRLVAGTISGRAEGDHIHVVAKAACFSASCRW